MLTISRPVKIFYVILNKTKFFFVRTPNPSSVTIFCISILGLNMVLFLHKPLCLPERADMSNQTTSESNGAQWHPNQTQFNTQKRLHLCGIICTLSCPRVMDLQGYRHFCRILQSTVQDLGIVDIANISLITVHLYQFYRLLILPIGNISLSTNPFTDFADCRF